VSGEWGPGDPIPSEIELASRYSVSQGTVRKAVAELADENLLIRYQGKGTFVASHADERGKFPFLRMTPDGGELKDLTGTLIDFRRIRADAASARLLRLPANASIISDPAHAVARRHEDLLRGSAAPGNASKASRRPS
jgi:GntR family transcriptional regulator